MSLLWSDPKIFLKAKSVLGLIKITAITSRLMAGLILAFNGQTAKKNKNTAAWLAVQTEMKGWEAGGIQMTCQKEKGRRRRAIAAIIAERGRLFPASLRDEGSEKKRKKCGERGFFLAL